MPSRPEFKFLIDTALLGHPAARHHPYAPPRVHYSNSNRTFRNTVITYPEDEVGSGVLQSNAQQIYNPQNFTQQKRNKTHDQFPAVCAFGIPEAPVFVDHRTVAPQGRPRTRRYKAASPPDYATRARTTCPVLLVLTSKSEKQK